MNVLLFTACAFGVKSGCMVSDTGRPHHLDIRLDDRVGGRPHHAERVASLERLSLLLLTANFEDKRLRGEPRQGVRVITRAKAR